MILTAARQGIPGHGMLGDGLPIVSILVPFLGLPPRILNIELDKPPKKKRNYDGDEGLQEIAGLDPQTVLLNDLRLSDVDGGAFLKALLTNDTVTSATNAPLQRS